MAGKKHHYIWQMIQRGFSWKEHSDNHVWVYSKSAPPKRTVTRKFGRTTEFYGPEGSMADENITAFENSVQEFVNNARNLDHGTAVDGHIAAALTGHLEMRSLFVRTELSDVVNRMSSLLAEMLDGNGASTRILEAYLNNHPEQIEAEFDKNLIIGSDRRIAREMMQFKMREIASQAGADFTGIAKAMFSQLNAKIPETAKEAHNKTLVDDFSEAARALQHRRLSFSVYRSETGKLILPDTTLAFITSSGCTPISSKNAAVEFVILPLSTEAAIIGRSNDSFLRDEKTICRVLASCSYENFIAPRQDVELERLSQRIGANAKLIPDSELRRLFVEKNFLDL